MREDLSKEVGPFFMEGNVFRIIDVHMINEEPFLTMKEVVYTRIYRSLNISHDTRNRRAFAKQSPSIQFNRFA